MHLSAYSPLSQEVRQGLKTGADAEVIERVLTSDFVACPASFLLAPGPHALGWRHPHPSLTKKMPPGLSSGSIFSSFLFPNDPSLCQMDIKTGQCGMNSVL